MTDSTHRHGPRHAARQRAVDILFEAEFRDTDPVGIVEERIDLSRDESNQVKRVPEYTTAIVPGVAQALDEIDDAIAAHLSSTWRLERLPARRSLGTALQPGSAGEGRPQGGYPPRR